MKGAEWKARARGGDVLLGTLIVSPSPAWPAAVEACGLDFVFIDTEHIALDRERLSWMCRTYASMGLPPMVRLQGQDPCDATALLDDGASGIIVPYVESAEAVIAMVGATRFRPLKGARLQAALRGERVEDRLRSYMQDRNQHQALIVNIESVPAIDQLDLILECEGLDAVLIGPHDLSTSLGVPEAYDHPKFLEACEHIFQKARKAGKGAAIHHWLGPESQVRFLNMGANILIHSADILAFKQTMTQDLQQIRALAGLSSRYSANDDLSI